MKIKNKQVTKFLALVILIATFVYISGLVGTFIHELNHVHHAKYVKSITINFDSGGSTIGEFYPHSHRLVYFNGYLAEVCTIMFYLVCLLIVMGDKK